MFTYVFLFLFLFSLASAALNPNQPFPVQTSLRGTYKKALCKGFCFTLGKSLVMAACKGIVGCSTSACSGVTLYGKKKGFSCVPAPFSPNTKGPVSLPQVLEFPPDVVIGGTISAEVTINVDEVSSASREDLYLLSDASGSMSSEIAQTKKDFQKLVDARSTASGSVAFGVGFYRDEEDTPPFSNLQPLTENFALVKSAIDTLTAKDGGDFPEANLHAMSQVATSSSIGWREGSRKILVYFGDAPGHEPTCPSGSRLTRESVIAQLNAKGIAVIATNFGNDNSGLNAPTFSAPGPKFGCGPRVNTRGGQASDIAKGTKGAVKAASNPKKLVDFIVKAVGRLDQELSMVTTDCAGKVDIEFSPDLPILIAAGETKKIMETAKILPGACATPDGFTCEINLLLSGVGVKQVIKTTSIAGCEKLSFP